MTIERDGTIRLNMPGRKLTDADKVEFLLDILCEVYFAPGVDIRASFINSMEGGVSNEELCDIYIFSREQPLVFDQVWTVKGLRAAAEKNALVLKKRIKRLIRMSVFYTSALLAVLAIIDLISKR